LSKWDTKKNASLQTPNKLCTLKCYTICINFAFSRSLRNLRPFLCVRPSYVCGTWNTARH